MNAEQTFAAMLAFKVEHDALSNEEILRIFEIAEAQSLNVCLDNLCSEIKLAGRK